MSGPCYFCGEPTTMQPMVDWYLGRFYFPACQECLLTADYDVAFYVSIHVAPEDLVARAYMFAEPEQERLA